MIQKITKCAIKRTAKTVGVRGAAITIFGGLFIAIAYFFGTIMNAAEKAFPIISDVFKFLMLWLLVFVVLFLIIFGTYDEYNANLCRIEKERLEREKNG